MISLNTRNFTLLRYSCLLVQVLKLQHLNIQTFCGNSILMIPNEWFGQEEGLGHMSLMDSFCG